MRRKSIIFVIVVLVFLTSQSVHGITWVNETRFVRWDSFNGWRIEVPDDTAVYISFLVVSGSNVSLRVFDINNYENWTKGFSYEAVVELINTNQDSHAFHITYGQSFFFILDNRDNSISADVEMIIQDEPINTGTFEGKPTTITLIVFGTLFAALGIILTIIFVRKKSQSKEDSTTESTSDSKVLVSKQSLQSSTKKEGWYCPNCNNKVVDFEEFCSYCGYRIFHKQ